MQITFELDDQVVFDFSKPVKVSFLLDKAYKKIRPELVEYVTHLRKTLSAFNFWIDKMNPAQKDNVVHSINSTLDASEIVPEGTLNRDLIIEAIEQYRTNKKEYDSGKDTGVSSTEGSDQ